MATWGHPEPRQLFAALITTPCQVWSRSTYPLPYYSVFAAETLLYAVNLTSDPLTLTCDLEHLYRIACDVMKLCTKSERNRAIRGGVIAISMFDLMTLNIALRVALGSGIIFAKFDLRHSTTWRCLNYSVFWCWYIMSRCDLDLWPVDLESSWYVTRHVIKVWKEFERNRAITGGIIDNFALYPWPTEPFVFSSYININSDTR